MSYLQYEDEETGVVARWHGGEYIDLGYVAKQDTGPFNEQGDPCFRAGDFVATDCINVWDAGKDEATIEFSDEALADEVKEHLNN